MLPMPNEGHLLLRPRSPAADAILPVAGLVRLARYQVALRQTALGKRIVKAPGILALYTGIMVGLVLFASRIIKMRD
ncbi:MAG: hypothetical protein FJ194_19125 [Gammaproteobacteria bacterium]|nr:hypothetical protein [Gammaproteobacteria bacterium]